MRTTEEQNHRNTLHNGLRISNKTNQPTNQKKKREKEQKTIRNGTIYKLPEQQDQIGQKPQKTLKANTTALNNEHQFEICKVQPILRRSHSNDFAREIETNYNREKTP